MIEFEDISFDSIRLIVDETDSSKEEHRDGIVEDNRLATEASPDASKQKSIEPVVVPICRCRTIVRGNVFQRQSRSVAFVCLNSLTFVLQGSTLATDDAVTLSATTMDVDDELVCVLWNFSYTSRQTLKTCDAVSFDSFTPCGAEIGGGVSWACMWLLEKDGNKTCPCGIEVLGCSGCSEHVLSDDNSAAVSSSGMQLLL